MDSSRHLDGRLAHGSAVGGAVLLAMVAGAILWSVPERHQAGWMGVVAVLWGGWVALVVHRGGPLWLAVAVGLLVRSLFIGSPLFLSDDVVRYVFEGLALNRGFNPFVDAPATLSHLDPALAARVNHAEITSIYPPVAQWWFRFLALGGSTTWAQGCTALVDLGNIALIHRLTRDSVPWAALVYALHPLAVLESASGAHLEPLGILCCLGVLVALREKRPMVAALFSALGFGVKLLPALFVPDLARVLGPRRTLAAALLGLGLMGLLALPVLSAGPALLDALGTYTANWSFNGLLFPLLQPLFGQSTRVVLGLLGLGVIGMAFAQRDALRAWAVVGVGFLALSPTVHPWYVLWGFVPVLVLGRRDLVLASSFLQGSYMVLWSTRDGAWSVPWWLGLATWGPAILVAVAGCVQSRRDWSPTTR